MSGISRLEGFRKRSKLRPCWRGFTSVMPAAKETRLPAAEPLPGPMAMPCDRAHLRSSETIRKYPGKPMSLMTPSSKSSLAVSAASGSLPSRSFRPESATSARAESMEPPSGIGNRGSRRSPFSILKSQASAMRIELPTHSGSHEKSLAISSGDLR